MRLTISIFLICAAVVMPASGLVSSGGGYALESSVQDNGGGAYLAGGEYLARGSAGQRLAAEGPGLAASGGYVNRTGFYNPPHFAFQKGAASVLPCNSGALLLNLPANAVGKEMFDIVLNNQPLTAPVYVSPGSIDSANRKLEHNEGITARLSQGHIAEVSIFDEQGAWASPLEKSGTISMRYSDADGDGLVDGVSPPVRIDAIRPWVLDQNAEMWTKLSGGSIDRGAGMITMPLGVPGVYALLGMLDESVKDTYAFPVPFRPNGPNAGSGAGQTGLEAEGVTFTNIPQRGQIEIYTLDGRLVRKLFIPAGLVIPKLKWDVRTSGGDRAASGVYLWRVVSGDNSKTGKLMVIW